MAAGAGCLGLRALWSEARQCENKIDPSRWSTGQQILMSWKSWATSSMLLGWILCEIWGVDKRHPPVVATPVSIKIELHAIARNYSCLRTCEWVEGELV